MSFTAFGLNFDINVWNVYFGGIFCQKTMKDVNSATWNFDTSSDLAEDF